MSERASAATAKNGLDPGVTSTNLFAEGRDAGEHGHPGEPGGIPAIDPIDVIPPRRKRGRPPKTGAGAGASRIPDPNPNAHAGREKAAPRDIAERIEAALISLHAVGAKLLDARELELEPSEAHDLTAALLDVSKYTPVAFDPKKLAIGNLAIVLVGIYGARLVDVAKRKRAEAARPAAAPASSARPAPAAAPAAPDPIPEHVAGRELPRDVTTMAPSEYFRANGAIDTAPIEAFE